MASDNDIDISKIFNLPPSSFGIDKKSGGSTSKYTKGRGEDTQNTTI